MLLLSPIRNNGGNVEPNWEKYYDLFMSFRESKREIAHSIGISESVLSDYSHNIQNRPKSNNWSDDNNDKIDLIYIKYKRYY